MALQWADFPSGEQGLYGTNTAFMLNGTPWVNLGGGSAIIDDPDPAIGSAGKVLRAIGSGGSTCRMALTSPATVVGCAFNFWCNNLPGGSVSFFVMLTTGNTLLYSLRLKPNGGIELLRLSNTTPLAEADYPVLFANSWNHLEMLVDTVSGEVEVRRNGLTIPEISITDPVPVTGNIGLVGFTSINPNGTFGQSNNFRVKNIVLYNGLGSTFNTFQGSVIVTDLRPNADDTLGGWTTSSGSNAWSLLNETPPADGGFISAATPVPSPAEVSFTNLPDDVTSVRGLISITRSLKTDGGDGNLQTSLTPNGTDYVVGADNPVTTAATYRWDISEISPVTTAPWSPTEVNLIRQRYDRTL
jgi:hypothetical protein